MSSGADSAYGPGGTPGVSATAFAAGGGGGAAPTAGVGAVTTFFNAKTAPLHTGPGIEVPVKIAPLNDPNFDPFLKNNGFWAEGAANPGVVVQDPWLWYDLEVPRNGHYIFTFACWNWGTLFVNGQDWLYSYDGGVVEKSRYLQAGTATLYVRATYFQEGQPYPRIGSVALTVGYQTSSNGGSGGDGYAKISWD